MKTQEFPNGFESWQETHFEIVDFLITTIIQHQNDPENYFDLSFGDENSYKQIMYIAETQGRGGLYELAKELTFEFENKNINREWDGDYFDSLDDFLKEKFGAY